VIFSTLNTADVVGLVSAVVSIALAVFAIWQSMVYYRWSNAAQQDAERSATAIGASVKKLEDLFDRLYSDAFGMLRETHTDMRKHIWERESRDGVVVEEVERRTEENLESLREELSTELKASIADVRNDRAGDQKRLEATIQTMIDRAIRGSSEAKAEAVESTARERLLLHLKRRAEDDMEPLRAREIFRWMIRQGFDTNDFRDALLSLRNDQLIEWADGESGSRDAFPPGSAVVELTKQGLSRR
jgi:hypothetical protein